MSKNVTKKVKKNQYLTCEKYNSEKLQSKEIIINDENHIRRHNIMWRHLRSDVSFTSKKQTIYI